MTVEPRGGAFDADEQNTNGFNPLVPRAIDLPTTLPAGGQIEPEIGDIAKIFAAPADPADWPQWRADLGAWRDAARERLQYRGGAYEDARTAWSQSAYSVAQIWLWDERLFDHERQTFTLDRFLEEVAPHGGLDGVVLWHAYPIIGIDDRNQFDFYRDVPGLVRLVAGFHARGVCVFVDYNPWDTGTRRAPRDDATELALLVTEFGVDGVFLDTLKEGDSRLTAALLGAEPPQVLEGESRVPNVRIEDHLLSWAQWFADSEAPGVMRAHWYERRHMMHGTRRWNRDHSDELQSAWMNGTGILVWDAVFGVWVGWNARDLGTHRRMLRVQRSLTSVFIHGEWSPLEGATPMAVEKGVYASRWTLGEITLWTLVNRSQEDYRGDPLSAPLSQGRRRVDVTSGCDHDGELRIPGRGVSGVLEIPHEPSTATGELLAGLERLLTAARRDAADEDLDADFPARSAERIVPARSSGVAAGDAILLQPGTRELTTEFRRRETGWYQGAPYVEQWKPLPPRLHDACTAVEVLDIAAVSVAAREVSVAEWNEYLVATGAEAAVVSEVPADDVERPATGMTLAEARAYATWRGARLPTEFEWQVAGSDLRFARRSPLVWNWTESEHTDGITRFSMLKGGSDYSPVGSDWYFDGGPRNERFTAKYLLAGLGLQASQNIGFRLAWDEPVECSTPREQGGPK